MRQLAVLLLTGFALLAGAAEAWRWKDKDGVVHYSDVPVPGAERVHIGTAPRPGGSSPPPPVYSPDPAATSATPSPPEEQNRPVRYTGCSVAEPANDAVFFSVDAVNVSLDIAPGLAAEHRIQVMLNGALVPGWPADQTSYTLSGLYRGSYTVLPRVVDRNGWPMCIGQAITFHIRQPSVLSPARRPTGN
jgi:hypothetical protein